jgi:UDP-N-acetylmuramoyl-L-alanyl-D-glutamate--2,6-diaminopimelate ligase
MGAVAGRLSDLIVITSDNPRNEDRPDHREVQRDYTDTRRVGAAPADDRRSARGDRKGDRARAIRRRHAGGGQGAENAGHRDRTLPFDDVAIAREALARRRTRSGVA